MLKKLLGLTVVATGLGLSMTFAESAKAELKVCNKSSSTAYVAVAYETSNDTWLSEGWWRIAKGSCEVVVPGTLDGYYYLYAGDEDENAIWKGKDKELSFCVKPDEDFKLTMTGDNCSGSGTKKRVFWELDLQGEKSFTQDLVD